MPDSLRSFLREVPLLPEAIQGELTNLAPQVHTSDELKGFWDQAQKQTVSFFKEEGLPYGQVTYASYSERCPDCGEELVGAYWELNNPRTGRGLTLPMSLFHAFVAHGKTRVMRPISNLGGAVVGEQPIDLDLGAISRVLADARVPPGLEAELANAGEDAR